MSKRAFTSVAAVAAAFMVMVGYLASAGSIGAQGTAGTPAPVGETAPHPAHIHTGTCAELGDVVFPLGDVVQTGMTGSPEAVMDSASMATPSTSMSDVVAESTTTVEAPLADIISGGHAINVHESAENIQNYIACGDITGDATDSLQIELAELNGSGYEGVATLMDNGDGTTTVTIQLMRSGSGTPAATPVS